MSDPSLNNRVKDCVKGHELYVHDTENSSGRDFSFELATAAKFLNAGFKVDFACEVDLKVEINGTPLFVECKRLKSAKKVRQRVKDGFDQLHNRYKNSENPSVSRGILFISIGKVINKNLGFLRGDSPKNLRDKALGCLCNFKEKHQDAWRGKLDHRTLAVVIVLDTPGYVYSEKKCYICHQAIVEPLVCSDSNNNIWLHKIFKRGSIF